MLRSLLANVLKNIDKYRAAIRKVLFSGAIQAVGHIPSVKLGDRGNESMNGGG